MSKALLAETIRTLPSSLRLQIEGYAATVDENGPAIFDNAHIPFDERLLNELIFFAGLRRLWSLLDGEFQLLDNSLELMEGHNAVGISFGQRRIVRGAGDHAVLRGLRDRVLNQFRTLHIMELVTAPTLAEMVLRLRNRDLGH